LEKKLRLILGDQLNAKHTWFTQKNENNYYLLAELKQEGTYVNHHIQKLCGFFSAMRNFAMALEKAGHNVIYIRITQPEALLTFPELILKIIEEKQISCFEYQLPDEYRLDEQLNVFCKSLSIPFEAYDTEHFLSQRYDLRKLYPNDKKPLMESFYRKMRKKHNVLLEPKGEPLGGKWNYDKENRNKYTGKEQLPDTGFISNNVEAVYNDIKKAGLPFFGSVEPSAFQWPINRKQSAEVLEQFCNKALPNFGKYQDAMHTDYWLLYHSRLSFSLNTKMLSPKMVIDASINAFHNSNGAINLAQIEGFVRQILGWREYMRGIYWGWMPEFKNLNYLNHNRKLPAWFWTGETKMNCLKHAINQSLEKAYAHHIQRLMVTGNFALLAGINPDEVDLWYLGIYIDAIEWVEITNTRGMSQFADGGIVGTKPYVSSANYMNKMSNYCQSCFYKHDKRVGDKACPFNSLYWNFYETHRDKFEKNPRIGMMYRLLEKMDDKTKNEIFNQADKYLTDIEQL
jgi:deoxyribodipyrimidine photolyase-related protein